MGPDLDALPVVDSEVQPCIAGTDFPCQINLRAQALPHNIRMAIQHCHLRRALKVPAVCYGIGAPGKNPARKPLPGGIYQCLPQLRAQGITHYQKIPPVQHDILPHGHIQIIVRYHEITDIQQPVDCANAALGENPLYSGSAEHPEYLPGGIRPGDAAAPAVHLHSQYPFFPHGKKPEGRALPIRGGKMQPICLHLYILRPDIHGKITGQSARTAHYAIFRLWNIITLYNAH